MQRVDAAIGELRADPRLCRIIAPADAGVVGVGGVGVVAVGEFGIYEPHAADVTARDHRLHVPDE